MWLRCCGPDSLDRVEPEALRSLGIRLTITNYDFVSDTATSYRCFVEITVPFARIFSRNTQPALGVLCRSQRQAILDLFG